MRRHLLFLSLILSNLFNAQVTVFNQNFNSSTTLSSYIGNGLPEQNQFSDISTGNANFTTTINNSSLRFHRTNTGTMYAYRNFDFSTNPRFVELKLDFEASNHELNKNNVFTIFLGSDFTEASTGSSSNFASRFGISTLAREGEFRLSTIDNIGGAPNSPVFSGKQTIRFIVNNTNQNQNYTAPDGSNELIAAGKMDIWIGTTRGIHNFSLKNTEAPKADISGFKIQATSKTGNGVFDFDNIEMIDLLGESDFLTLFNQNFNESNDLSDYVNSSPNIGQFSNVISEGPNFTTNVTNQTLRFNRKGVGTMYAYRNFDFSTNPRFINLKLDFEASKHELNKNNVFSIFVGSDFSESSLGSSSIFTSRFGISTGAREGEFRLSSVDNIGGAPSTPVFTGKQTIQFIVNNTNQNRTYVAPNGNDEVVAAGKMDLWVGTTLGINDFTLKNSNSSEGDITGFKIQATSRTGNGIFDFDNIQMVDLLNEAIALPKTQSLVHPHIWVSNSDRQKILNNIDRYEWASSLFNQLEQRNIDRRNSHASNPASEIGLIPSIPGDRTVHRERLNVGAECAILYYLTQDERYAQIAADILHHYVNLISVQNSRTFKIYSTSFNHLIQTREHFPRVGIIYDFVHPYLVKPSTTVYDKSSGSQVPFNFSTSQKAFEVLSENVLFVGGNNSNHPVLELPGALHNILNMEDDAVRASFFDRIMNLPSNTAQPGVNWMIDRFSPENRLWPESSGYGKFTHAVLIQQLNVIDRYRPDLNIIDNNKDLLESIFLYENLLYPNNAIMAYGDIGRSFNDHAHIFRSILAIADRKGYTKLKERATQTLQKIYREAGGYKPQIFNQRLEYRNPLQLLWGVNVDANIISNGEPEYSTVTVKHAGVVMQRNYSGVDDEQNGLMYYTHGGTYVHTHAGGIDMELYGAGYVIGPDYGADSFESDIHEQYAVSHAAHNTIIVNGASQRGIPNSGTWENITDEVVLEASEPKALAKPIAANFSFSTQFLNDDINNVDQQRTNSIVRTSSTTGYYVDVFRSNSNTTNNFHDYLFHGLGDEMQLDNELGEAVSLQNTPNRYQNDIGDRRKQPGWRWFSEAKTSALTTDAVKARFDIQFDNKYLHVNIPGGVAREYSSALSPPTKEVRNGYDKKDTQMLIMRKYGEAWEEPFIAIYEPSSSTESTVKSTSYIYTENKIVGVKVTSLVNGEAIIDYVLSNDSNNKTINLPEINASFTGRFGVIRTKRKQSVYEVSLYIGEGQQIIYEDQLVTADSEGKAFVEFTPDITLSSLDINKVNTPVSVYPNPTHGIVEFNLPASILNVSVKVYNLYGQVILSKQNKVMFGKTTLDITNLPKGVYFVKLDIEGTDFMKIVKS